MWSVGTPVGFYASRIGYVYKAAVLFIVYIARECRLVDQVMLQVCGVVPHLLHACRRIDKAVFRVPGE